MSVFKRIADYMNPEQKKLNDRLLKAAEEGDVVAIEQAIKEGANIDARDDINNTPLCNAAYHGHTNAIKALLKAGANVNVPGSTKYTALHTAAYHGHIDAIIALLDAGAKVDSRNEYKHTPLYEAIRYSQVSAAKILVAAGADFTLKCGSDTPIELAKRYDKALFDYLQSIADGKTQRPTVDEVLLDMKKRNTAVSVPDRVIEKPVVGEHTAKVLTGMEAQRQAALKDPGEGI